MEAGLDFQHCMAGTAFYCPCIITDTDPMSAEDHDDNDDDDTGSNYHDPWTNHDPWQGGTRPAEPQQPSGVFPEIGNWNNYQGTQRTNTAPVAQASQLAPSTAPTAATSTNVAHNQWPRRYNEDNCVICLENPVKARLLPCLHAHFCVDCAALIVAGAAAVTDTPQCPLCRADITGMEQAPEDAITDISAINERVQVTPMMDTLANVLSAARAGLRTSQRATVGDQTLTRRLLGGMETPTDPMRLTNMFGPWWPAESDEQQSEEVYLNKMLLSDDEVGIMPDTGAHSGLCGSVWARKQAAVCAEYGKYYGQERLPETRHVSGVGQGSQKTDTKVILTVGMVDTSGQYWEEKFEAPCLPDSRVPGLMGIDSMKHNDVLYRCKTGEIWFLGKGGVKIEPSPGSRHFQMKESKSGHWMIPICRFRRDPKDHRTTQTTMTTTETRPPTHGGSSSSSSWQ